MVPTRRKRLSNASARRIRRSTIPRVAAIYFLKSAQLNMAEGNWGRFWLAAAVLALVIAAWKLRTQATALFLLWIPLPFYALSIAYGSVPVHVYTWWPFATFNQRYGLQLLPMFAVSTGVLAASVFLTPRRRRAACGETGSADFCACDWQLCDGLEWGLNACKKLGEIGRSEIP